MSFKIVRNDIVNMRTQAIVNTANEDVCVGPGCDEAVYRAAGYNLLLEYRRENIGHVPEGEAFITPGFGLPAEYIIHAVSPLFAGGDEGEERKLRACYRNSLALAKKHGITSIAFPLIATGGFGYPKEEGLRIAVDEIYDFLFDNEMDIVLVVFDEKSTKLGKKIFPDLRAYIDRNYAAESLGGYDDEDWSLSADEDIDEEFDPRRTARLRSVSREDRELRTVRTFSAEPCSDKPRSAEFSELPEEFEKGAMPDELEKGGMSEKCSVPKETPEFSEEDLEELKRKLDERQAHLADTFSEYLLYLIASKGMTNAEVYKRAIVDKKLFAKIKNDKNYHPAKITCLCLCVGAQLNLDETRDLLARAGYALSPSDMRDVIFSFFIENEFYDIIEIDIQLEEYGLGCMIE